MMEDEGYRGPGFDDWVEMNKETFKSSLLAFPLLMLPGATYDTIATHGKNKIANRVMTQRAKEALNLELADTIAEATKFDNYKDFASSVDVTVDDIESSLAVIVALAASTVELFAASKEFSASVT
jgi:hypothetical protein